MKTANVNGTRLSITYRTDTKMYTRLSATGTKTAQYGADVYDVVGDEKSIVLVATAANGSTLAKFTKVISIEEYEEIADLYDVYNEGAYHLAVMAKLGFE